MVKKEKKNKDEIRTAGNKALVEHLGVVGTIRFLQHEDKGTGDYTRERHRWLGNPEVDLIANKIEKD